jgi:hypothetical protein
VSEMKPFMTPWPKRKNFNFGTPTTTANDAANFNCILAHAAMDRLRVAVEALKQIKFNEEGGSDTRCAEDALEAIGELPDVRERESSLSAPDTPAPPRETPL